MGDNQRFRAQRWRMNNWQWGFRPRGRCYRDGRGGFDRCDDGGRQTPCSYCDNAKKAKQYAEAVLRAIGA